MKKIVLLGSTGSIGRSTVDVLRQHRDKFQLLGLAAGSNVAVLEQQIQEFNPMLVAVREKKSAENLRSNFPGKTIVYGSDGLTEIVSHPLAEVVVSAISGTDAIEANVQAIRLKRRLCLANKETLVTAGELVNRELERSGAELIPIDSEQSAIFQCLGLNRRQDIQRLILTASGGPFWGRDKKDFPRLNQGGAGPSGLVHGQEDQRRFGHLDEQGPGNH